jgi:hypothetical protein
MRRREIQNSKSHDGQSLLITSNGRPGPRIILGIRPFISTLLTAAMCCYLILNF